MRKPSPALLAAERGNLGRLRVLLKKVKDLDARHEGQSLLSAAATAGHAECVQAILEAGARVDATDSHGNSALLHAAYTGQTECCQLLLNAGANPNLKPANEESILDITLRQGHEATANLLLDWQADFTVLSINQAIDEGLEGAARRMLTAKPSLLNQPGQFGDTPLIEAAKRGNVKLVKHLLDRGAHIDAQGSKRWSALMHAQYREHEKVVRLLIRRKANQKLTGSKGESLADLKDEFQSFE